MIVILIGGITDYNKEKQFQELLPSTENQSITVIRNGEKQLLSTSELLVGDIIQLKGGDELDVDALIIEGNYAEIDQSQLTGLSETLVKKPISKFDSYYSSETSDPFLYSGSTLLSGNVTALVLCVGINCQIGQLKHRVQENELKNSTILDQNLGNVAKLMVGIGVVMATVMFISLMIYFFMSLHEVEEELFTVAKLPILLDMFMESFLVIVLSVPEGLPMVLTLSLAFTVKKQQPEGIVTRKLNVCYAMGGCNELLIDKTGTLTENNFVLGSIYFDDLFIQGFQNIFNQEYNQEQMQLLKQIAEAMLRVSFKENENNIKNNNNNSNLEEMIKNIGQQLNDKKFQNQIHVNLSDILQIYPYNSNTKYSAMAFRLTDNKIRLYFKGNPEILLGKCSKQLKGSEERTNELNEKSKRELLELNREGLKSLALAFIDLSPDQKLDNPEIYFNELTLLTIIGFQEKLRDDIPEIAKKLEQAGINVRIVTGDTKEPTMKICSEIGFDATNSSEFLAIDGNCLKQQMELNNTDRLLKMIKVVYCASSSDKQLLTEKLINQGNIVGYMGDGINDTQALQHCDIGLSFSNASSIAQQSASIIFCNSNPFSKLLVTISYGKNIYENIQRFINLQLTFYIVSIFLIVYSSIKIGESPLSIVQIIWLSLVQDVFSSIAIATELPTDVAWLRQGFKRNEYVISKYIFKMIFLQVSYQIFALILLINSFTWSSPEENIEQHVEGWDEQKGIPNTIIFMSIAWMQLITLICSRRIQKDEFNIFENIFSNKNFMAILAIILTVLFSMAFFGGKFVQCSRLTFYQHFKCFLFGVGSFVCFFLAKIFISLQEKLSEKLLAVVPQINNNNSSNLKKENYDQEEKIKLC